VKQARAKGSYFFTWNGGSFTIVSWKRFFDRRHHHHRFVGDKATKKKDSKKSCLELQWRAVEVEVLCSTSKYIATFSIQAWQNTLFSSKAETAIDFNTHFTKFWKRRLGTPHKWAAMEMEADYYYWALREISDLIQTLGLEQQ
jgi:hypothetical protein